MEVRVCYYKRRPPRYQTELECKVQDWEEYEHFCEDCLVSMFGFVVPAQKARSIEPGNLYVRRYPGGKEFVRVKEHKAGIMCGGGRCDHRRVRKNSMRQPSYHEQDANLMRRLKELQAELDAVERHGKQQPVPERERRPYHHVRQHEDATPPPESAEEAAAPRRGVKFATPPEPELKRHACRCEEHHHQHRRPSYHHAYFEDREPEQYRMQEHHAPAVCRYHNHRKSTRVKVRNGIYYDDIPWYFRPVLIGGRRRISSGAGCRRLSRQHFYVDPCAQYEAREPDNYYYY